MSQSCTMWRPPRKLLRQRPHVDAIAPLERCLAGPVLLDVMIATEADDPAIGRLKPRASVGIASNMRALDWAGEAARHAAVVLAHPGTVGGTLTSVRFTGSLALKPVR